MLINLLTALTIAGHTASSISYNTIVFKYFEDGITRICLFYTDTRTVECIFESEQVRVTEIMRSPTNAAYLLVAYWDSSGQYLGLLNINEPEAITPLYTANFIRDLAWSPDGEQVAFAAGDARYEPSRIYILSLDHPGTIIPIELGADNYHQTSPAWSPDGRRIIFSNVIITDLETLDTEADIYVMDVETMAIDRLTSLEERHFFKPKWSHDGQYIAMLEAIVDEAVEQMPSYHLHIMDVHSGEFVFSIDLNIQARTVDFAWSSVANQLAFTTRFSRYGFAIYDVDENSLFEHALEDTDQEFGDWSPDGQSIAYFISAQGWSLYILDVNTMASTEVYRLSRNINHLVNWSP